MDPNQIEAWKDFLPQSTIEYLLNPTAETLGQSLDGVATALCWPLLKLRIIQKAKLKQFAKEIQEKCQLIPVGNRDSSKIGLAVKSIEEARYQLNEDDIRKMYVNLIASTVDNRKNNEISPRLATVVAQLGKQEANLLELLFKADNHTILTSELWGTSYSGDFKNSPTVLYVNDSFFSNYDASIDILKSLGVIDYPYKRKLINHEKDYLLLNNYLSTLTPQFKLRKGDHPEFREGYIEYTNFGGQLSHCIFE